MVRTDGRRKDQLRPVKITRNFIKHAEGSVLIEMGDTKVICTASVEDRVPPFLKGAGKGWITGEYGMIPRSTQVRKIRDAARGRIDGRTMEIQRLIGRALRSIVNLEKLGEITIFLDCDVIQADGGTRTAAITGAFVALVDAIDKVKEQKRIDFNCIESFIAAISVGLKDGEALLDLDYSEDSTCQVDMNIIMTEKGEIVEIQGTGEEKPFTRGELDEMLSLGEKGIKELISIQKNILGKTGEEVGVEEDESNSSN